MIHLNDLRLMLLFFLGGTVRHPCSDSFFGLCFVSIFTGLCSVEGFVVFQRTSEWGDHKVLDSRENLHKFCMN